MTINNIKDIVKHLEIIEKEASQIVNYSGEFNNHKFNILKSVEVLKNTLNIEESEE